ncbi:hypothetical protein [Embleya sp. NBC_00896]|uniref:hypothetical protein n=1 Tax=Embleya sp. NBC_00896 TaxID=2975961 RepID=UPI00386A4751|nr:hypothetical protein OG928_00220 [Embleya sp. NBC_00896]
MNTTHTESSAWKEAWASTHYDGCVTLTAVVGGHPVGRTESLEGWQVQSSAVESAVADFMALVRVTARNLATPEYDVSIGIAWSGDTPLVFGSADALRYMYAGAFTPLHHYTPVTVTVAADSDDIDFHWQVHDLAQDCINQGGIARPEMIHPPARND